MNSRSSPTPAWPPSNQPGPVNSMPAALGMLGVLAEHQVRYAIVGGVGARLQRTPYVTGDLDIVPAPDPANLGRLAQALSSEVTKKKHPDSTDYLPHPVVRPEEFFAGTRPAMARLTCSSSSGCGVLRRDHTHRAAISSDRLRPPTAKADTGADQLTSRGTELQTAATKQFAADLRSAGETG